MPPTVRLVGFAVKVTADGEPAVKVIEAEPDAVSVITWIVPVPTVLPAAAVQVLVVVPLIPLWPVGGKLPTAPRPGVMLPVRIAPSTTSPVIS